MAYPTQYRERFYSAAEALFASLAEPLDGLTCLSRVTYNGYRQVNYSIPYFLIKYLIALSPVWFGRQIRVAARASGWAYLALSRYLFWKSPRRLFHMIPTACVVSWSWCFRVVGYSRIRPQVYLPWYLSASRRHYQVRGDFVNFCRRVVLVPFRPITVNPQPVNYFIQYFPIDLACKFAKVFSGLLA